MKKIKIYVSLILLFFSCQTTPKTIQDSNKVDSSKVDLSQKDEFLRNYADYLIKHYNFEEDILLNPLFTKLLNDTVGYEQAVRQIWGGLPTDKSYEYDSLFPILDSLHCDEAYRFSLWRSMLWMKVSSNYLSSGQPVITIFKSGENFQLDYFISDNRYEKADTNHNRPISVQYNHKRKSITEADWLRLQDLLNESYFWSLMSHEENNIVDGSSWTVSGYIKPDKRDKYPKSHNVHRRSPRKNSSFFKLGELFVNLANEDIGELR